MRTRPLTGRVITPEGVAMTGGVVRVTPLAPYPADDVIGALAPTRAEYTITAGTITGTIVAPAMYKFEVLLDGRPIWVFIGHVADVAAPISLQEIYSEAAPPVPSAPAYIREGDTVMRLSSGPAPSGQVLTALGDGAMGWSSAGAGDMTKAVYDPDDDGIVVASATAAAVPWTGVTDKPATFPPSGHAASHAAGGGDAVSPADIGAAPASHTHPGSEVTSQVASAAAADSVPWEGIAGKPSAYPPEAHAASHASGASDAVTPAAIGALPLHGKIVTVTSSRELALSDAGAILLCTGTITITAPNGLPHGFHAAIANVGTGTVTLDAVGELKTTDNHRTLARQCTAATIIYNAPTNTWYAFGALTT